MYAIAIFALLIWTIGSAWLYSKMRVDDATCIAMVVGWLLLPNITLTISGLPDVNKTMLISIVLLWYCVVKQRGLRARWIGIDSIAVFIAVIPFVASLMNKLGIYDGLSTSLHTTLVWVVPYVLGRSISSSRSELVLTTTIVVSAIAYLPLTAYEMRMSPQLHNIVYGESWRWNGGGLRYGSWRPIVFMDGGLQLALWMAVATLIAFWLWRTRVWKRAHFFKPIVWLVILAVTTVLCKSLGALVLLALGIGAMLFTQATKTKLALLALLFVAPTYIVYRIAGEIAWQPAVDLVRLIDGDRAQSLEFRFQNEDILIAKALQKPLFGWGGWGRSRVFDDWGNDISVTDGLWIIEFGQHGFFGLASLYALLLAPLALLLWRYSAAELVRPELAPPLVLAVVVTIFAIDCLPNAMPNPVYTLAAGGLVGFAACRQRVSEPLPAEFTSSSRLGSWTNRSLSPGHSTS